MPIIPPTSSEQLKTYEFFYFDTYRNSQVYEMTTCLRVGNIYFYK